MGMTPVYNIELLAEIAREKEISCDELWKRHSDTEKAIYNSEINVLLGKGYIKCEDDKYIFVYAP